LTGLFWLSGWQVIEPVDANRGDRSPRVIELFSDLRRIGALQPSTRDRPVTLKDRIGG
jgi:hypothetical protein